MLCIPFRIGSRRPKRSEGGTTRAFGASPRPFRVGHGPRQPRQGVRRNGAVRGFLDHRTALAGPERRAAGAEQFIAVRDDRVAAEIPDVERTVGHEVARLGDEHRIRPLEELRYRDDLVERTGDRARLGEQHEPGPIVEQRLEVANQNPSEAARPPVGRLDAVRERASPDRPAIVRLGGGEHDLVTVPQSDARNQPPHQRRVGLADGDLIFRPVRVRVPKPRQVGPQVRFRRPIGAHRPRPQGARRPHGVEIKAAAPRRDERIGDDGER